MVVSIETRLVRLELKTNLENSHFFFAVEIIILSFTAAIYMNGKP